MKSGSEIKRNEKLKTLNKNNKIEYPKTLNIKPLKKPDFPLKHVEATEEIDSHLHNVISDKLNIVEGKKTKVEYNQRIKALELMKKNKNITKDEINKLSNKNTEELNKLQYINTVDVSSYKSNLNMDNNIPNNKNGYDNRNLSDISMINRFEQYYNDKFVDVKDDNIQRKDFVFENNRRNVNSSNNKIDSELKHILGINVAKHNMVFHKIERWIAYTCDNLVKYK